MAWWLRAVAGGLGASRCTGARQRQARSAVGARVSVQHQALAPAVPDQAGAHPRVGAAAVPLVLGCRPYLGARGRYS